MSAAHVDPEALDQVSRFDETYQPRESFRPKLENVPNGNYDLSVVDAALARTNTGKAIFKLGLRVEGGPASVAGLVFEHVYFPAERQAEADRLGADLLLLGFGDFAAGRGVFSRALAAAVPALPGLKFRASKTTEQGDSREFHSLRILARLGPAPRPAPAPQPAALPAQPAANGGGKYDDDSVPF